MVVTLKKKKLQNPSREPAMSPTRDTWQTDWGGARQNLRSRGACVHEENSKTRIPPFAASRSSTHLRVAPRRSTLVADALLPCFSMVDGGRPVAFLVLLAAAGIARRATLAARRHKHPQRHRRRGSCFCRRAIETQCGCAARRNLRPAAPPAARDICSREHRAARARCSS